MFVKISEQPSLYNDLEKKSVREILEDINREDQKVALAVQKAIPQIEKLVTQIVPRMKQGGRIFYMGAGTSGRLGVLDASEIPPTFGMPPTLIIGLIAGGDTALRNPVENAEDDMQRGWEELVERNITDKDTVIGIAASGTTPYVIGALHEAREHGILTACITSNPDSPMAAESDVPIEMIVGPEYVTGSSRMKSGTGQKMILNMITTSVMIQLGRVKGNKMVNMQLSNKKLVDRGTRMLVEELGLDYGKVQGAPADARLGEESGRRLPGQRMTTGRFTTVATQRSHPVFRQKNKRTEGEKEKRTKGEKDGRTEGEKDKRTEEWKREGFRVRRDFGRERTSGGKDGR